MSGRVISMHKIIIFIFIIILNYTILQAEGTNAFNFLQMSIGSRAQGMGKAFTSIPGDINGMYYNPASLSFCTQPTFMFYHSRWIEDISVENISFVYPNINRFSVMGGISFLHLPDIEGYDELGNRSGSFQVYDLVAEIGAGYRPIRELSFGFMAKFIQERIDDVSASGVAFDFGFQYKIPVNFLRVGASIQHMGPNIKYEQYKEKLPLTYRLGASYQLPYNPITFSVDAVKTNTEDWKFYPGLEVEILNSVLLRSGYHFQQDEGPGYNVGLGFKFLDNYKFNYVFTPYGILGNTHRAEFVISFGKKSGFLGESDKYSESYKDLSLRDYNEYEKTLEPPSGLRAIQSGKSIIIAWNAAYKPNIKYNIYVEIPGKTGIVKINKKPIGNISYTFHPRVSDLEIKFYITLVKDGRESRLSDPISFKYKY